MKPTIKSEPIDSPALVSSIVSNGVFVRVDRSFDERICGLDKMAVFRDPDEFAKYMRQWFVEHFKDLS